MLRVSLALAALAVVGCKSNAPTSANTATPPSSAPIQPKVAPDTPPARASANSPPHPVDELFRGYRTKLPAPATLSEGNGASLDCPHHGYVTYTLLEATGKKLPLKDDDDLPALIPWLRDGDPCLRQITLEWIMPKIGFDSNKLSLPNMHDPEHFQYHDVFVSLKTFLDQKRVAYGGNAFDGLMLSLDEKDFSDFRGAWKEEIGKAHNFQYFVDIDAETIKVTHKLRRVDPKWPDNTQTTKIKDVRVNERVQYVVTGAWWVESNSKGYVGPKVEPSDRTYAFWPVAKNILWFDNGTPGEWRKLTR